MIFLQLYRMTNRNRTIHISIMEEDTLLALLRTVNEQSTITCHVSNAQLKKKSVDIFVIQRLVVADKILPKWSFPTTVVTLVPWLCWFLSFNLDTNSWTYCFGKYKSLTKSFSPNWLKSIDFPRRASVGRNSILMVSPSSSVVETSEFCHEYWEAL